MKHIAGMVFAACLILTACNGTTTTPVVTEPPVGATAALESSPTTAPSPTAAPTSTALPPAASTLDIKECKLPPFAFTNVGLGIPAPKHKLPSLGEVHTVILFADFEDVPASQTPEDFFKMISPDAESFYSAVSYGRMDWQLEPHFTWLRLSQPSAHYGEAIRSYEGHLEFIQEAVALADPDVDFSTADSVTVMVPPSAAAIEFGPAFGANPGNGYRADGKVFSNGVTSASDLPGWGFIWLNHETGHTMGLPDLYSHDYDPNNYAYTHRFVGNFGFMGYTAGTAFEPFAFERWQLGWLDDDQVLCHGTGEMIAALSPIETAGGVKTIMVPISDSKAVMVESRRDVGFDSKIVKTGALVYVVDTSIESLQGPIVVYPILENDPYRDRSPLAAGESVVVEGVTILVLEATDNGDVVQVSVAE